ncbi:MAG: DUF366 family protein [Deltaproteobacteria bacterium]|jgi:hypothetical protein|nr:DUF366 family protein [Deltaproteobacteria bacterium]
MTSFQSKFLNLSEEESAYDGRQLKSLFSYLEQGILGDSIVAWVGPCHVPFEHMVDGEDLRARSEIRGTRMVHFIVEKFGASLSETVALQRLLSSIAKDVLLEKMGQQPRFSIRRSGDDLYVALSDGEGKLSISIATISPVSGLIHFAVNVSNEGTPVKTAALEDLRIPAQDFAESVLWNFSEEMGSIKEATCKVKWVR